jgi:RHS repeat-associated protein
VVSIKTHDLPRARLVLRLFAEASGGTVLHEQEDYLDNTASWSWQQLALGKLATVDCWAEVYVENLAGVPVWFDDLEIATGALPVAVVVQETHYDPWGLELSGIGYNAPGNVEHRWKFNGGVERTSDFGLNWDESGARMYDPQVPHFLSVDPLADKEGQESWTPYHYGFNNPARYNDPDGRVPPLWAAMAVQAAKGAAIGVAIDYAFQVAENLLNGQDVGDAVTNIDGGRLGKAAAVGALTGGTAALAKGALKLVGRVLTKADDLANGAQTAKPANSIVQTVKKAGESSAKQGGSLTKAQQKSVGSLKNQIEKHKEKLAEYVKDPAKFDNKGFLKNAPNDAVRQKIIQSRVEHLQKEINTFQQNIDKIQNTVKQ